MPGPLDRVLHPYDQQRIVDAIRASERLTSAELKVHVEARCPRPTPLARAQELFAKLGLTRTRDRNGVLIYLAVRDRRFALLGDLGLGEDPGSPFWGPAEERLRVAFRAGAFGQGVVAAIQLLGARLAQRFPRAAGDQNQIENAITTDESAA